MKAHKFLSGTIIVLSFISAACNQPTAGKATAPADVSSAATPQYPHPKGWATPTNHGAHYFKQTAEGRALCLRCHSANNTKAVVSCYGCHSAFPHAEGFMDPSQHKSVAQTNEAKCTACHKGGFENPINEKCSMCHAGTEIKTEVHWKDITKPAETKPSETKPADKKTQEKTSALKKKLQRLPSNK